jgi:hypothetical protein
MCAAGRVVIHRPFMGVIEDKPMSKEPDTADKVGYGHPPKHSRFKPGQSGNPRGRPKGRQSFLTDLIEVLEAPEPGATGNKTNQRRIIENLVQDARERNTLALKIVVPLAVSLDNAEPDAGGELTELQQQLVDDFDRRSESADPTTTPSNDGSDHEGGDHE